MMKLNDILQCLAIQSDDQRIIKGISDDSRVVEQDWLFIAATFRNNLAYVEVAKQKGAIVISDEDCGENSYVCGDLVDKLSVLLNSYYHQPDKDICVIAITGTNGKSSVANIMAQCIQMNHQQCMVIGTGHIQYLNYDIEIANTTPSACMLAYYIAHARDLQLPYVVMEVSSHAIDQGRIQFLSFDYVLYTNISEDHLDYHLTKTHYRYTKFKLRNYLKKHGKIILNNDYVYMNDLYQLSDHKILTFGRSAAHYDLQNCKITMHGSSFSLMGYSFQTKMLGLINIYNITEVLIVMRQIGVTYGTLQAFVENLHGVSGRLEVLYERGIYVWIDYAHTTSSLQAVLQLAIQVKQRNVICIVGCGGNRDRGKRAPMCQIAASLSDTCILTADNPRDEPIAQIFTDMLQEPAPSCEVFENRAAAIKYAVAIAEKDDIIIIAGKGNERVQWYDGVAYPFWDWEYVMKFLKMEGTL